MQQYKMLQEMLFDLCSIAAAPGEEKEAFPILQKYIPCNTTIQTDLLGNIIVQMGNSKAKHHIMLDAHIDRIAMIVTGIHKDGFLHIAPCGGIDARVLPGLPVQVLGKETLIGIICFVCPQFSDEESTVTPTDKLYIDVGLSMEEVKEKITLGDRIVFSHVPKILLGNRVSCAALDDRAGCAVLLYCAKLLENKSFDCLVSFVFSVREELRCQGGAGVAAYSLNPTEAIAVDVSFATQPGVSVLQAGKLGRGPMLGIAPSLDKTRIQIFKEIAKKQAIEIQIEVMGGTTGTNADKINLSRSGVPVALLSIPLRYMHTPVEVVDLKDVQDTAQLIAAYIKEIE